ncbi:MAG: hypothetical protein H0U71_03200 [Gammaproteobacteria bacterium]|nr:hypothetical protein [Gammaproteobacteria bacterium]
MGKQTFVINFDGAITPENKFVFYESGPGLIRVGYHIDEEIKNRLLTKEKIVTNLFEFYEHIYIVSPADKQEMYLNFGVSEGFFNANKNRLSLCTLEQFISQKQSLNQKGAIIAVTEPIPMGQPFHYSDVLIAEGVTLPVINSSMMFRIFCDKNAMSDIFHRHSPEAMPPEAVLNLDDLVSIEPTLAKFRAEYVVLKPVDGSRACGIVLVPKEKTLEVLKWLADENPFKMLKLPHFDDPESKNSLVQLDGKITESGIRYCIAQECIAPALLEVQGSKFRPTVRPVVVAHYDSETDKLSLRVSEMYYKLPTTPISSEKLLWDETISYHIKNCEIESRDQNSMVSAPARKKLAVLKAKVKFPYTVLLSHELYETISNDIIRSLTPVVSYLFNTTEDSYYAAIISEKNNLAALYKNNLRLSIHKKLDDSSCQLFKSKNLNTTLILLYHLYYRIDLYERIKHKGILQPAIISLLLRYQDAFGDKPYKAEIEEISRRILDKIHHLEAVSTSNELLLLKENLTSYSQGNLSLSSSQQIYLKAAEHFKEGNYTLANKLFIRSSLICDENSKEQATCFYSLASSCIKQDQYQKAAEFAAKAVDLRALLFENKNILKEDLDRAIKKLNDCKALVEAAKKAQTALALFKQQNYPHAIKEFKSAIDLYSEIQAKSTTLATYHYNIASSYLRLEMKRHAIDNYEKSYSIRRELLGESNEITKNTQDKLDELKKVKGESSGLKPS